MSKRKRREGEVVCTCGAYRFPHRQLGGQCTGLAFIADTFEMQLYGSCLHCNLRDEQTDPEYQVRCQVLDGIESTRQCDALAEHIAFEGIKLYGVNKS